MLNETQQILSRLAAADREHQKEASGRLLLRSVKYLCAFVLTAFLIDVIFHLRAGWRLGLLLALIAGMIALAGFAWYLAFIRRNRLEHIARFLESRDATLGSRLINLLQLREQSDDPSLPQLTRKLARTAVAGYAEDLRSSPLEHLARTGELSRQLKRAVWALLLFAVLLGAFFRVTAVELARFADPFGDHPPYSFTRLEIVQPGPAGTNVLYGKGILLKVKATGHQPKTVLLTAFPAERPEETLTLPMFDKGSAGFDQLLDNIRGETVAFAHTKDGVSRSKQVRIGVVLTPQIEKGFVRIAPPEYTGLKTNEMTFAFKGLQALAGSEVRFRLQSNRPLREGLIEITSGEEAPRRVVMHKSAENEVSASLLATESGRLRFSITDVAGLPSTADCEAALTVTHDLPPEIRITEPAGDAFVAMDFKLSAHLQASDDYGLRSVRFHRALNGVYPEPWTVTYDSIVRDAREVQAIDFDALGVQPGDVISMFAEALDTAPEPHMARSQTVRLMVISVEDYNNFLREQTDIADIEAKYDELNADLQELIDRQKQLGESAQELKDQLARADARQLEALTQALDGLLAKQSELNQQLDQHAERMDRFVREHPLYDVETELQEYLQQQASMIRRSTDTNTAAGREIAARSAPPGGPRQIAPDMLDQFRRESDEQVARLGGVREQAEQQVAQTLQDMSLMQELIKDFNQFEALYRTQQELAEHARAYNRPGQLSREDQLALKELAATEKQVADLLQQVTAKLRKDADAAEKLFPKAAQSGRTLADRIEELRLRPLAQQATGQMLAGKGDQSYQLAERLRGEMEKLFGECAGGNCPSGSELDGYLALQRMKPGNNFAQMSRSRKFGTAQGMGMFGMGEGQAGTSGYAVVDGSSMKVMGNETQARQSTRTARDSSRQGKGSATLAAASAGTPERPDVLKGLNPVNRQSAAIASETVIEEYSDLVETYFQTITTKKTQE